MVTLPQASVTAVESNKAEPLLLSPCTLQQQERQFPVLGIKYQLPIVPENGALFMIVWNLYALCYMSMYPQKPRPN